MKTRNKRSINQRQNLRLANQAHQIYRDTPFLVRRNKEITTVPDHATYLKFSRFFRVETNSSGNSVKFTLGDLRNAVNQAFGQQTGSDRNSGNIHEIRCYTNLVTHGGATQTTTVGHRVSWEVRTKADLADSFTASTQTATASPTMINIVYPISCRPSIRGTATTVMAEAILAPSDNAIYRVTLDFLVVGEVRAATLPDQFVGLQIE